MLFGRGDRVGFEEGRGAWYPLLASLVIIFLCTTAANAQQADAPGLFFDALPFAGDRYDSDSGTIGRIDIYAAVPYRLLDFARRDERFEAEYRMTIGVENEFGESVFDTTWYREVRTTEFGRTDGTIPASDYYQHRLAALPGSYRVTFSVRDERTRLAEQRVRDVVLLPFDRYRFSLSGLLLLSEIRAEPVGYRVVPLLSDDIGRLTEEYFLLFESYNRRDLDSIDLDASYVDESGTTLWQSTIRRQVGDGRDQGWVRLPIDGFPRGEYRVDLVARSTETGDTLALSQRTVRVTGRIDGMPMAEAELEEKIRRLRYAATQREIDYIDDASAFADRRARYAEFWIERDPTPGTAENEAMTEYFRRIEYADRNFRSYAEGWLTDMGRIYIVFGPADRVDRDPFASDGRPEETWEYYRIGRSFRFVDQTGFGDFRLVTPVPLSEKYRYR